jgi:hypothetical protein
MQVYQQHHLEDAYIDRSSTVCYDPYCGSLGNRSRLRARIAPGMLRDDPDSKVDGLFFLPCVPVPAYLIRMLLANFPPGFDEERVIYIRHGPHSKRT